MFGQIVSSGSNLLDPLPDLTGPSWSGGFLRRLRERTGMAGAALVGTGARWLDHDGQTPPGGLAPDIFGPSGQVTGSDDPSAGFIVVVPIPTTDVQRQLWLLLWDSVSRPAAAAHLLLAQVTELVSHAAMERRRAAEIHRQHLIERASATARIGIWSCSLPDERLVWTDGVYDLFQLPRGSTIDRAQVLRMYEPESARRMQELRAQAIATLGDFNFDAEIVTARGEHRWMRITATVDGVDGVARRIFGMKQNITEEKQLAERTRRLAETDALTGLANRSLFQARLDDLHGQAGGTPVDTLFLVDLDRFKSINDELGHVHGDACLIESGRRLMACCPPGTLVARIGGDEFAILTESRAGIDPEVLCARIIAAFDQPFALAGQSRRIGASLGFARRGEQDADTLYRNADTALYQAKSAGRGTWRRYNAA